jgi:glycosyltransferase involved in cell wall biosynthesis
MKSHTIVHTIASGGFYGAERVVFDLMRHQKERARTRPMLLDFLDPGETTTELGRRLRSIGADVSAFPASRGASWRALRTYARHMQRLEPDIVHAHGYKPRLFHVLTRLLGWHAVPLIVTSHGYSQTAPSVRERLYYALDVRLLRRANSVVGVSNEMADYIKRRSPGLQVRTVPNGIDTTLDIRGTHPLRRLLEERPRAKSGGQQQPEPLIIGAVGRLVPMKNHSLLIDVASELRNEWPCVLVILGDGPLRSDLEQQWRRCMPDVEPLLVPHQDDVLEWMNDMDIFCMPSGPGEGLPMALLEAGLLGRPVVCSDSGGIPDLIHSGVNGFLFAMNDRAALKASLAALLANSATRREFGTALRETVLERHDAAAVDEQYFQLYRSVWQQ